MQNNNIKQNLSFTSFSIFFNPKIECWLLFNHHIIKKNILLKNIAENGQWNYKGQTYLITDDFFIRKSFFGLSRKMCLIYTPHSPYPLQINKPELIKYITSAELYELLKKIGYWIKILIRDPREVMMIKYMFYAVILCCGILALNTMRLFGGI